MKILAVCFATAATIYHYTYDGDVDVEVGDWGVANNALVTVKSVCGAEEYKPTCEAANISNLKPIVYVISRKAERQEAIRVARIKEIKAAINELKVKVETRRAFEEAAGTAGAEGKKLLDELKALEGDI